jgi:hypothetical protein
MRVRGPKGTPSAPVGGFCPGSRWRVTHRLLHAPFRKALEEIIVVLIIVVRFSVHDALWGHFPFHGR